MKKSANAKVNLALNVTGINEEGYHDLDMIMAPVSLCDHVVIEKADADHVEFCGLDVPADNTVTRALRVLRDAYPSIGHYEVVIEKNIPEQAGLAGGSADAAAVIEAVDEMEGLGLSLEEKIRLGVKVGADVPFCLVNKTARVQGIGEKIRPIDTDWRFLILLVKPEEGVSTPRAFRAWDEGDRRQYDVDGVEEALVQKDEKRLHETMANALEGPAKQLVPTIGQAMRKMKEAGVSKVMMTGSGSALMGFGKPDELERARAVLQDDYPFVQIVRIGSGG